MLDLPQSPTLNQLFLAGSVNWRWDGVKWVNDALASGPYLPIVGGTLTGVLNITPSSGNVSLNTTSSIIINSSSTAQLQLQKGASGQACNIYGMIGASAARWALVLGTGDAESGSNNGSHFGLYRYTDAGALIDLCLVINRSTADISITGHFLPAANNTKNLGSTSSRWATVYTADLSLNNGVGDWTLVEGEDDLFLYNNKKGKTYKFNLVEVDPSTVPSKRPE